MTSSRAALRRLLLLVCCLGLSACAVGPDYTRPVIDLPDTFAPLEGWKRAEPGLPLTGEASWSAFGGAVPLAWFAELDAANASVAQAEARMRQAQATAAGARAGLYPTLSANGQVQRSPSDATAAVGERYVANLAVSWVPDLWGGVRRGVEAGQAGAQASAAELAAVRLATQAELMRNVLRLRVLDRQRESLLLSQSTFARSLELTRNQYAAGLVTRSDVVLAETQWSSVGVELRELGWRREQLQHAIAVLLGRAPGALVLADDGRLPPAPAIPQAVPARWLERRPDIAAAERSVAAANARIGVAVAAWYPDLTLSASGGWQSTHWADWLSAPARVWSLGPALAARLFDGGARRAGEAAARAAHDEQAARYRQTVLTGLREVDDALVALRGLDDMLAGQARVVALAEETERLVRNRYEAGLVSFLEVAVAQNTLLTARRRELDILGTRLDTAVSLVAALGGGWEGLAP